MQIEIYAHTALQYHTDFSDQVYLLLIFIPYDLLRALLDLVHSCLDFSDW